MRVTARTLLAEIGMKELAAARWAGVPYRTMRSWVTRDNMPAAYLAWLVRVRDAVASVPPPDRSAYRVRRSNEA